MTRSDSPGFGAAPSLDDLAVLAESAFAALPDAVRRMTGEVLFRVEDFAPAEVLEELGIEDPFELTGLYQGVDIGRRSIFDVAPQPSMIFLYRRPILDEWAERSDVALEELVSHVLVHEIGHHFGLSDAQIAEIESSA